MFKQLSLLLALTLSACAMNQAGVPAGSVSLAADRSGSEVRLTLRNDSATEIQYNLCTSALQRRMGTSWQEVQTGDVCTMELRGLQPGRSATFDKSLPSALPGGEYRYVTRVHGETTSDAASNHFAVP